MTCPDTVVTALKQNIADVKAQIPSGSIQSFGILQPASAPRTAAAMGLVTLATSATGNWTPDSTGLGYAPTLEFIQYGAHFDWLKANRPSFTGTTDNPPTYTAMLPTIDGVKQMFVNVGTDASATLVKGLDKDAIEAVLANAIAPLNDQNAVNYDHSDSRVIFLVDNYNAQTQTADAIGVLTIEWHLQIADYKEKKSAPTHKTSLSIKSRSVLYSSIDDMNADYAAAKGAIGHSLFLAAAIPTKAKNLNIFKTRPEANRDTFLQSVPKKATTDLLEVIVLYAPSLQIIGSIDNSRSATTTTYSQSITEGFKFSTSQSLQISASLEVDVVFAKFGLSVAFTLSFTEEWSNSRTITMTFAVPPGKKSFNYQGYMIAEVLTYDPKTDIYTYQGESARCLTNVLVSSETPPVDSPQS